MSNFFFIHMGMAAAMIAFVILLKKTVHTFEHLYHRFFH